MAVKNHKFLTRIILDIIFLLCVGIPILILYLFGKPTVRGFFCNDSTIRYPFLHSTIPRSIMLPVNYIVPTITFILVEAINLKAVKPVMSASYHHTKIFAFGAFSTTLLTDVTKYTVGRPRPHFIEVCNPDVEFNNVTCGTDESPIYVTEYKCRGNEKLFPDQKIREEKLKESRLSFCSGHASLSWFAMFYMTMFLQWRLRLSEEKKSLTLLKALLQLCCLMFALYTSVTRIADYKHHPGDVLAGSVLGVAWAVIIFVWLSGIDRAERTSHNLSRETLPLVAKSQAGDSGPSGEEHTSAA